MGNRGLLHVVRAHTPLAQMFGYATRLRSLSQGRANFTMQFVHYAPVRHGAGAEMAAAASGR